LQFRAWRCGGQAWVRFVFLMEPCPDLSDHVEAFRQQHSAAVSGRASLADVKEQRARGAACDCNLSANRQRYFHPTHDLRSLPGERIVLDGHATCTRFAWGSPLEKVATTVPFGEATGLPQFGTRRSAVPGRRVRLWPPPSNRCRSLASPNRDLGERTAAPVQRLVNASCVRATFLEQSVL
jgi:hypothetical protein